MRTLLLADDNVIVQRVIKLTFAQEPVRIVTASDGHQAMDRVMTERPDIVLAGTTLPQMNGYELAKFVKSNSGLADVPVLLLSGAFEIVDEDELRSSGANGVIEKPVEPTLIISRVKELLGIRTEDGAAATPTTPRPVTTSRPMPPDERPSDTAPPQQTERAGGDAYLNSLESAFASLDQQLAGELPATSARSASVAAQPPASGQPGKPVYEIDETWFAERPNAMKDDDLRIDDVDLAARETAPPVFEIDDQWFADSHGARAPRLGDDELAREMGVHEAGGAGDAAVPAAAPDPPAPAAPPAAVTEAGVDFETLLAFEQGEPISPETFAPTNIPAPPAITPAMLEHLAAMVAERLKGAITVEPATPQLDDAMLDRISSVVAGRLSDVIRESMQAAVRDAITDMVLDTSERLIREEIDRIKSQQR